jgi:hypothetical protein
MCIPMLKWLEIFLASMYTQIKALHKIVGFNGFFRKLLYPKYPFQCCI